MSTHALYSPSGAKKWMTCAGSVAMEQGQVDDSEYGDEGTAAHALAAMCLTGGKDAKAFLGRKLHVVNGVYDPGYKAAVYTSGKQKDGSIVREFIVDLDMAGNVNTYANRVRECAERGELLVEERVPISHITGEDGAEGTSDAIVFTPDGELQVHDLKFGKGVRVYAEKNPQGMMYLLGSLRKFEPIYGTPKRYRFVIHQRDHDGMTVDEWDCTYEELMAFAVEAKAKAAEARFAFSTREKWIGKVNGYLVPGEHCRTAFCKARATCPALAKFVEKTVGADFEVLAKADVKDFVERDGLPQSLEDLGRKNAAVDLILDWCKQIRGKVEAALFENLNSAEAQSALGFKLVEGKKGNRSWRDTDEAEALLKKMRLKTEEIYDFSVKTPPVLEKALKEQPKRWGKLVPLITQKHGQPSVTELTDRRPALVIKPAADEFEAADGSDLV